MPEPSAAVSQPSLYNTYTYYTVSGGGVLFGGLYTIQYTYSGGKGGGILTMEGELCVKWMKGCRQSIKEKMGPKSKQDTYIFRL